MNKQAEDIFEKAWHEATKDEIKLKTSLTLSDNNTVMTPKNMNLPQVKNWNDLTKAMEGPHLERFNNILNHLPDREYARFFLKLLPFFKMPLSKNNAPVTNQLTQININIHRNNSESVETKTVEIK